MWRCIVDATWSSLNTWAGAIYYGIHRLAGNPHDLARSAGKGSIWLTRGVSVRYATTIGTVKAGSSDDIDEHEEIHVMQARIFGPLLPAAGRPQLRGRHDHPLLAALLRQEEPPHHRLHLVLRARGLPARVERALGLRGDRQARRATPSWPSRDRRHDGRVLGRADARLRSWLTGVAGDVAVRADRPTAESTGESISAFLLGFEPTRAVVAEVHRPAPVVVRLRYLVWADAPEPQRAARPARRRPRRGLRVPGARRRAPRDRRPRPAAGRDVDRPRRARAPGDQPARRRPPRAGH